MDKLANGFTTAVLTSAAMTFKITGFTPPEYDGGDLPDTTTNSNQDFMSVGLNKFIKIGKTSLTASFEAGGYDEAATAINTSDILTVTFFDGSSMAIPVIMNKFTPDELTTDSDMPTATIEFSTDTGTDGTVGVTYTAAP